MKKILTYLLIAIIFTSINVKAENIIDVKMNRSVTYRKELNGVVVNRYMGVTTHKVGGRAIYCIEPMVD